MTGEVQKAGGTPVGEGYDLEALGYLSETHRRFAEYIGTLTEEHLRARYEKLRALDAATLYPSQPWPVFLSQARADAFAAAATGVVRILLDLPRRVFENDPARFQEFYQLDADGAQLLSTLIKTTDVLDCATARGDFLETTDGLKCLELNVSGGLGGWSANRWTQGYLGDPLVRDFLDRSGVEVRFTDPLLAVFEHVLAEAGSLVDGGEFNIAFAVPSERELSNQGCWPEDYERAYGEFLAAGKGLAGKAVTCKIAELEARGRNLHHGDLRIHTVMEACGGNITRPVLSALLAGTARVYNGPVSRLLGDKLNLALLSEMTEADLWSPDERKILHAHIPWTRRMGEEFVDFEGERVYLPDLLCDEQERMVIKSGYSAHGAEVFIGAGTPREAWEDVVERAAEDQGWVAQEFLEGKTYLFPVDEDPSKEPRPHDLVWGLLTFGDQYGGNFVRLMARGGHGVINAARGACVGAVFEVEEGAG